MFGIISILLPFLGIVQDVVVDTAQFLIVSDDPIMETGLPGEIGMAVVPAPSRDRALEMIGDGRNGSGIGFVESVNDGRF